MGQLATGGTRRFRRRAAALVDGTSRMTGDCQARICERLGVKFPRADSAPWGSGKNRSRIFFRVFFIPIRSGVRRPSRRRFGVHVSSDGGAGYGRVPEKSVCREVWSRAPVFRRLLWDFWPRQCCWDRTGASTKSRLPVLPEPQRTSHVCTGSSATGVAQAQDISVNDCFKPVSRYWDRISRPEQLFFRRERHLF